MLVGLVAVYGQTTTVAVAQDVRRATGGVLENDPYLCQSTRSRGHPVVLPAPRTDYRNDCLVAGGAPSRPASHRAYRWRSQIWCCGLAITGGQPSLIDQLSDAIDQQSHIALVPCVAVVSALLAVSGSSKGSRLTHGLVAAGHRSPALRFAGQPNAERGVLTVLVGVPVRLLTRYAIGGEPERTTGAHLIAMIRRARIDVVTAVRIDDLTADDPLYAYDIVSTAPLGHTNMAGLEQIRQILAAAPPDDEQSTEAESSSASSSPSRVRDVQWEINGLDAETFREDTLNRYPRHLLLRSSQQLHCHRRRRHRLPPQGSRLRPSDHVGARRPRPESRFAQPFAKLATRSNRWPSTWHFLPCAPNSSNSTPRICLPRAL